MGACPEHQRTTTDWNRCAQEVKFPTALQSRPVHDNDRLRIRAREHLEHNAVVLLTLCVQKRIAEMPIDSLDGVLELHLRRQLAIQTRDRQLLALTQRLRRQKHRAMHAFIDAYESVREDLF